MKKTLSITTVVCSLLCVTVFSNAQNQADFQQQYNQLSAKEKEQVRAEATKKEDYNALPYINALNDNSVREFCKELPRGLETLFTQKVANKKSSSENRRAHLWAKYLSCKDSLLYYEGHRFFDSGHYSDTDLISATAEIKKVMTWLLAEEAKLDSI